MKDVAAKLAEVVDVSQIQAKQNSTGGAAV